MVPKDEAALQGVGRGCNSVILAARGRVLLLVIYAVVWLSDFVLDILPQSLGCPWESSKC